ncbi:MAG TPA: hypothetical protein VFN53_09460 [Acidobacteriaceae bacterium]|nr:hypothetical protein [Acidobacteriaceae bacterium]
MRKTMPCLLAILLLWSAGCSAATDDFDSVVSGVEHRYSTHAHRIPLVALIGLCARVYTRGGVEGMHIAEIDNLDRANSQELFSLVQSRLGDEWQPIVADREQRKQSGAAGLSVIFARPDGRIMQLMIADYENGELNLVRMGVDGARLSSWINEHEHGSRQSD